jgi:hypothetical protein
MPSKTASKTKKLPKNVQSRLQPYIDRGVQNGIFVDDSPVVDLFSRKANDPNLRETIQALGGMKSPAAQGFVTDCVLTDLSNILRQKSYTAHMDVWEVAHRTVGIAKGNPRPVCFIYGQAVVEDGDAVMEPAMFSMSLWDDDAALADDLVRGSWKAAVSCRNLDAEMLDLRPLTGLTAFNEEEYDHSPAEDVLRNLYDVTDIADLEDDISRTPRDYRLVEATVSYAGVQTSRTGNQFGKVLLKDESTMTMDAIESGENLMLNCITTPDIASRYGRYSRILALITTKVNGEYGLSANLEIAVGLVVVEPPKPEVPEAVAGDDGADDAADYFADDDDEETQDSTVEETVEETATDGSIEAESDTETVEGDAKSHEAPSTDDDWDDWE